MYRCNAVPSVICPHKEREGAVAVDAEFARVTPSTSPEEEDPGKVAMVGAVAWRDVNKYGPTFFEKVLLPEFYCCKFAAALKTTSAARWSGPNWRCQPPSVPLPRRTCPGRIRWIPCWATVCSTRRSPSKRFRQRGTSRRPGAGPRASRRQSTCSSGCPERSGIQPTVCLFCHHF